MVLTRVAGRHSVIQMIPTLSSCSFDEIIDTKKGDQIQWLRLYLIRIVRSRRGSHSMQRAGDAKGYSSRLMLRSLGVEKRVPHLPFTY